MEFEVFNDIEIRRDVEEEAKNSRYTCYKMYLKDEIIGFANYRLFNNQSSYWYIDEFVISEQYRGKGYGSYLLKHILDRMWNEQNLPIHIYPTSQQIPKEKFTGWLINRGFVKQPPMSQGQIFCIIYPPNSK